MRSSPYLFFFALLAFQSMAPFARAQGILFRWKLEPGLQLASEFTQEWEQGASHSATPATRKLALQRLWEVLSMQPDGSALMETKLTNARLSMNIPGAGDVAVDTAQPSEEESGFAKQIGQMFRPMIGVPCSNQMALNGKISNLQIPDVTFQSFRSIPMGLSMESAVRDSIEKASPVFPEAPIKPGHIWTQSQKNKTELGTLESTHQFVYVGTTAVDRTKLHQFSIVSTVRYVGDNTFKAKVSIPEQKTEGVLLFDNERGFVYSSEITQKMTMRIEIPDQPVVESKLAQKTLITFRPQSTRKP